MPTYEILCRSCRATVLGTYTSDEPVPNLRLVRAGGPVCEECRPNALKREKQASEKDPAPPEEKRARKTERLARRELAAQPVIREQGAPVSRPEEEK